MPDTQFVVERLNWRRVGGSFYRLPGETRVGAFDTFEEAEAHRAAEEGRARAVVNPFAGAVCVPADCTHWPEHALCDFLHDHGIDPPPLAAGKRDWAGWWDREHPDWTEGQRQVAWVPLDKVAFFRVREAAKKPVAYAVVRADWGYNDEWSYRDGEGGTVETLYRSRPRAEAVCAEQNDLARSTWGGDAEVDDGGWREARADPFAPAVARPAGHGADLTAVDDATFYEVVEVELEGEA